MLGLRATFKQGLTIGFGGLAFMLFGCLGAVSMMERDGTGAQVVATVGMLVCLAGLIAALVGFVLFVKASLKALGGKGQG